MTYSSSESSGKEAVGILNCCGWDALALLVRPANGVCSLSLSSADSDHSSPNSMLESTDDITDRLLIMP